ncbi:aminotransferase class V-fold PLP-dependent enzyme [Streptomyces hoynatensis]|uniref:Aminotransferase class V-fold PLP-dependent enzyme n=1 Tax=Streptomyces hoynatensis TaxID=1141874 RepID=A0A3A9YTV5_9ACTN|nr:aminotransferase class V-fold PLP-dependent enzyme [Streptomyces hoynatensis]RKN38944.1 aminotransferase class V-fold PLP-dependent enzyme [Streptomyces hoynatensis]
MQESEESLAPGEYRLTTTYLNTASHGLLPARAVAAAQAMLAQLNEGTVEVADGFRSIRAARESFARLAGVGPERVAIGGSVAGHAALIAGSLQPGSEVLCPDTEFSSLVTPFAQRPGLRLRTVPPAGLAEAVGPDTALVAVSAVQSLDGRVADLPAIHEAAGRHGARLLVDLTQALGWLPLSADDFDFTVCAGYKWLLCPRGTSFLTVPADGGGLPALHAGWVAGEEPWRSTYGPVGELAHTARRYDEDPTWLCYAAAAESLALVEELGPAALRAHALGLGDRFRAGLASLGIEAIPAASPIVSVPGAGEAAGALREAGVRVAARGGHLRAAFHLYNTAADADRALGALARAVHASRGA